MHMFAGQHGYCHHSAHGSISMSSNSSARFSLTEAEQVFKHEVGWLTSQQQFT